MSNNKYCTHATLESACADCLIEARAKLQAAEAEVQQLKSGIHPAKKPMGGGFSLDKFMADVSPEDAAALGEFLDQMEAKYQRQVVKFSLTTDPNPPKNAAYWKRQAKEAQAEVARLLDVGADAFHEVNTLHAAKDAMETDLIYVTSRMDEHPEGYEGACWCRSCCSYATDDGEGKP